MRVPKPLAVVLSVVAGLVASILVNMLTDSWTWPLVAALAVAATSMVAGQLALGGPEAAPPVTAAGPGSVAAGEEVDADIETEVTGTHPVAPAGSTGVSATGPGAVAAGRRIGGRIRTRIRRR